MLLNSTAAAPSVNSPASEISETSAYEALWTRFATVPKMARLFRQYDHAPPSQVAREVGISDQEVESIRFVIAAMLPFDRFSVLFSTDASYPHQLHDAKYPPEVLYYQGALDLLASPSIAVVGSRKATEAGLHRAHRLARLLVSNGFIVISGLAEGIDTAAHRAALEAGGRTIAVIGTPLHTVYPRENLQLQRRIARDYLLISQVPFYLYSRQDYRKNRFFSLERNKTMSALSQATVIVEASETSGALTQAEAAIRQGRKLFILNSCFEQGLEWPNHFNARGAIRVVDGSEILESLGSTVHGNP